MRVQDLLHRKGEKIVAVRPGSPLMEAMRLMAAEQVGTVLVMDGNRLEGIISERDFVRIFTEYGAEAVDFPVCRLTRRSVITCHDDATLQDLTTLMSNNGIRHLPVLRDGRVVGMISARDVLGAQKGVLLRLVERHKQAYQLALRARKDAEQASRHKTEFLNHMSHELRTPLNAIIGFSTMIASQAFGPVGAVRYADYAGEIGGAGEKLLAIINEILEMSRLEMGTCQTRDEEVELGAEIDAAMADFARWAADKQVDLGADAPPGPVRLIGDRAMVGQMLRHLLCNAVKFTPRGGRVRIAAQTARDGGCSVTVSDTGIGIAEEALGSVTRPFWQVEGTMSRHNDGAGLGLALTDAMIVLHDGSLEIASTLGKGTRATLRFPAERRDLRPARENARLPVDLAS
jgi:signal transduction histidine kinase